MKSTVKYFDAENNELPGNCVTTVEAKKVGKVRGDGRRALWNDSFSVFVAMSAVPGEMWNLDKATLVARKVDYKKNPSLHKCDGRCRSAKGHVCECECGGKFHGVGN